MELILRPTWKLYCILIFVTFREQLVKYPPLTKIFLVWGAEGHAFCHPWNKNYIKACSAKSRQNIVKINYLPKKKGEPTLSLHSINHLISPMKWPSKIRVPFWNLKTRHNIMSLAFPFLLYLDQMSLFRSCLHVILKI